MTTKHVSLRLEPDLHSWLVRKAAGEHRSINGHIEHLLEQERALEAMAMPVTGEPQHGILIDGDPASLVIKGNTATGRYAETTETTGEQ